MMESGFKFTFIMAKTWLLIPEMQSSFHYSLFLLKPPIRQMLIFIYKSDF